MIVGIVSLQVVFLLKVIFSSNTQFATSSMTYLINEVGKKPIHFPNVIDAFNIVVTSYGFMINFFPIYVSMK